MKKNLLIYCYSPKRLEDLVSFTNHIKDNFNILFIIHDDEYELFLRNNDYFYINVTKHPKRNKLVRLILDKILPNNIVQKILINIRNYSVGQYINEIVFNFECKSYAHISKIIFQEFKIDLFITITDRCLRAREAGIFVACKFFNIQILLPYLMKWNPESNYNMVKNSPKYTLTAHSSYYQKKVFENYSYQTYKSHYFYQAFHFRVLNKLGILSKMPWLSGGNISNIVAVSDILSLQSHIKMGIDENKLKILGDISLINLHKSYTKKDFTKSEIIKKYNLKNSKNIIIGLANWWEHNLANEQTHWELIFNTIEPALQYSDEFNILISLHPSMKVENYKFLETKYPIKILQERLMHILPIADIYIADQSSTVPWAIICGIKTFIICYYRDLNLFSDFTSITYAREQNKISKALENLILNDISFEHDWELLSRDEIFNNKIVQNYIDIIYEMIDNK